MGERLQRFEHSAIDMAHRKVIYPWVTRGKAKQDREIAHERALDLMEKTQSKDRTLRKMSEFFSVNEDLLKTEIVPGLAAPNPLGIAAGFDKNARVHRLLGHGLGFGIITVGTITPHAYAGNERPRIFDLPHSNGLINRMGFPGEGAEFASKRLAQFRNDSRNYVLFGSVGASKPTFNFSPTARDFYIHSAAHKIHSYIDALEINVSSPNTEGVRGLQEPDVFIELAQQLKPLTYYLPLAYKFSPELPIHKLIEDIEIAINNGATIISLTNTTVDNMIRNSLDARDLDRKKFGGISGAPLKSKAMAISNIIDHEFKDEVSIKYSGGISNVEDLWEALTFGRATIVDVYTSFVRKPTSTPNFAYYILKDLVTVMRALGMTSMEDFKQLRGRKVAFPQIKKTSRRY